MEHTCNYVTGQHFKQNKFCNLQILLSSAVKNEREYSQIRKQEYHQVTSLDKSKVYTVRNYL